MKVSQREREGESGLVFVLIRPTARHGPWFCVGVGERDWDAG